MTVIPQMPEPGGTCLVQRKVVSAIPESYDGNSDWI